MGKRGSFLKKALVAVGLSTSQMYVSLAQEYASPQVEWERTYQINNQPTHGSTFEELTSQDVLVNVRTVEKNEYNIPTAQLISYDKHGITRRIHSFEGEEKMPLWFDLVATDDGGRMEWQGYSLPTNAGGTILRKRDSQGNVLFERDFGYLYRNTLLMKLENEPWLVGAQGFAESANILLAPITEQADIQGDSVLHIDRKWGQSAYFASKKDNDIFVTGGYHYPINYSQFFATLINHEGETKFFTPFRTKRIFGASIDATDEFSFALQPERQQDIALYKLNRSGEILNGWPKILDTGFEVKGREFIPLPQKNKLIAAHTDQGIYLTRINASGEKQWEKLIEAKLANEHVFVKKTKDNGYVISCTSLNEGDKEQAHLFRLAPDSTPLHYAPTGHHGEIFRATKDGFSFTPEPYTGSDAVADLGELIEFLSGISPQKNTDQGQELLPLYGAIVHASDTLDDRATGMVLASANSFINPLYWFDDGTSSSIDNFERTLTQARTKINHEQRKSFILPLLHAFRSDTPNALLERSRAVDIVKEDRPPVIIAQRREGNTVYTNPLLGVEFHEFPSHLEVEVYDPRRPGELGTVTFHNTQNSFSYGEYDEAYVQDVLGLSIDTSFQILLSDLAKAYKKHLYDQQLDEILLFDYTGEAYITQKQTLNQRSLGNITSLRLQANQEYDIHLSEVPEMIVALRSENGGQHLVAHNTSQSSRVTITDQGVFDQGASLSPEYTSRSTFMYDKNGDGEINSTDLFITATNWKASTGNSIPNQKFLLNMLSARD